MNQVIIQKDQYVQHVNHKDVQMIVIQQQVFVKNVLKDTSLLMEYVNHVQKSSIVKFVQQQQMNVNNVEADISQKMKIVQIVK